MMASGLASVERIIFGEQVVRVRVPDGEGPFPVFLLLHGWTGDEDAMWVFTSRLPEHSLLLAPRGAFKASLGGYSWYDEITHPTPHLDDFNRTVDQLLAMLNTALFPQADFEHLHILGFSQGAAASYAFTLRYPELVTSVAGLAGFMPEGAESLAQTGRLKGLPSFVSHGTQDTLISVERARRSVKLLKEAGAIVTYCEDDVGHKLSVTCFRNLESFYQHHFGNFM